MADKYALALYTNEIKELQPGDSLIGLGNAVATQVNITAQGALRLEDTTGGEYMALRAPSTVTVSTTLTLPDGDGSNGQVLTTDGSGTLSWGAAGISTGKSIAMAMIFGF